MDEQFQYLDLETRMSVTYIKDCPSTHPPSCCCMPVNCTPLAFAKLAKSIGVERYLEKAVFEIVPRCLNNKIQDIIGSVHDEYNEC